MSRAPVRLYRELNDFLPPPRAGCGASPRGVLRRVGVEGGVN